jgi:hypothetical protein
VPLLAAEKHRFSLRAALLANKVFEGVTGQAVLSCDPGKHAISASSGTLTSVVIFSLGSEA